MRKTSSFKYLTHTEVKKISSYIVRTMAAKSAEGLVCIPAVTKSCVLYIQNSAYSVGNLLERCYVCNIQCGHYSKILSFYFYELFVMMWIIILGVYFFILEFVDHSRKG